MHNAAVDFAQELDRAWFAANPARSVRIRDAVELEFDRPLAAPKLGFTWRVIVTEIRPGVRVRTPLAAREALVNEVATEDDLRRIVKEAAPWGQQILFG